MEDSLHKNTTNPHSELPLKILQRTLVKLESESLFIATAALGATLQAPFQPLLFYPAGRSKQKGSESKPRGSLRLCTTYPCSKALSFPWMGSQGPAAPGLSAASQQPIEKGWPASARACRAPGRGISAAAHAGIVGLLRPPSLPRDSPGALPPQQPPLPRCPFHAPLAPQKKPRCCRRCRSLSHREGPAG